MALRHRARIPPVYVHPNLFKFYYTRLPPRPYGSPQGPLGPQSPRPQPPPASRLDFDTVALAVVTVLSFLLRFFRLHFPKNVVFDELHFVLFLENHLENKFTFDIHPWLGKLTLAAVSKLFGYRPSHMSFEIGVPYQNNDYLIPRATSAFFGALCIPLFYLLPRELGLSRAACIVAVMLPMFDNLLLTQSRYVLVDSQLIFYLALTLLLALRLFREAERFTDAKAVCRPRRYFALLYGTAAAAAAALSIKWTAAVTPLLVAIVCVVGAPFMTRRLPTSHCLLAGLFSLTLYVIPWYIHIAISTQSTRGATHVGMQFRKTLHGNTSVPYDPNHNMTFAHKVLHLHWRQFDANRKIKTRHKWESKWYEWPLNQRGIYYSGIRGQDVNGEMSLHLVYIIQNAAGAIVVVAGVVAGVVWLLLPTSRRPGSGGANGGALGFGAGNGATGDGGSGNAGGGSSTLRRRRSVTFADGGAPSSSAAHARGVLWFLLAGYVLNLVPYMFVKRCYFVYHYLPALMYGQLITAIMVDRLPPGRVRVGVTAAVGVLVVAAFVYWSPWVYATQTMVEDVKRLRWMSRWD